MKIRNGFVSNSSSSSFIVFGKWADHEISNVRELRDKGFLYYDSDEDGPCVGVQFDIQDNETWLQYKERVAKVLTEAGVPSKAEDMRICTGTYMC